MEIYTRINNIKELNALKDDNEKDTNILITKDFEFPKSSDSLFFEWKGNIMFEEGIKTDKVYDMEDMFMDCKGKIEGLEYFDTSNVINMNYMFYNIDFNNIKDDLTKWNLSNLQHASGIFSGSINTPKKYIKHFINDVIISTHFYNFVKFKEDNEQYITGKYELAKPNHYEIEGLPISTAELLTILSNNYNFKDKFMYFEVLNVFKYLIRFDKKDRLKDLNKARDYLNSLIYHYERELKENE